MKLDDIREPQKSSFNRFRLLICCGVLLSGATIGVLQKILDAAAFNELPKIFQSLDITNYFGRFAIWILVGTILSVYARRPLHAAINCFLFFVGMVAGYYIYCNYVLHFLPTTYMLIWVAVACLSHIGDKCMQLPILYNINGGITMRLRYIALTAMFALCITTAGCGAQSGIQNREGTDVITDKDFNDDADKTLENENVSFKELSDGDVAPDFEAELVGGGKFSLSENAGKVVLINIWATWCGPCVEEMPAFEKLNSEYGEGVSILCINCMEEKSDVDSFVKDNGYTFPIAYDVDGTINMRYPTQGIPYTVVVGKDGTVKNIFLGSNGEEEQYRAYKEAIEEQLSK